MKFLTLTALSLLLLAAGCSDPIAEIEPPERGGHMVHVEGSKYLLMVRYRSGVVKQREATLVDKRNMPVLMKSLDAEYHFQVDGCGKLRFLDPYIGQQLILNLEDQLIATSMESCGIHFGALEDEWYLK